MDGALNVIVVAEDEELTRSCAVEALTDAGFQVIEAAHATEALSFLQVNATTTHLLFTDIHMPGSMNGLELAHHARHHWPWIAILVASGNARPRQSELPPGGRFLPKPYDLDHMISHVHDLLAAG